MISDSKAFDDALMDEALISRMVPWPCPSEFGPGERYRLEEVIGVGQTSLVYRAVDTHMSSEGFDAEVAIKVVGAEGRQRQEAINARRVKHDNVVRVLDRGITEQGVSFIVEELVEGSTLESETPPLAPRRAAALVAKIARGMQAVHAAGVVHCDLKPANVLVTEFGEPKLSDFGLASAGGSADETGGNLAFMSPERFADPVAGLTPSTDVYALAGLLFFLLTGKSPNGATPEEIQKFLLGTAPAPAPGVDHVLDAICRRGLARDPNDRHDSAGSLADDLEAWLRYKPIRWMNPSLATEMALFVRRHWMAVGAAAIVCMALLSLAGGWIGLTMETQRQQIEATQEAARLADESVEEIKARMRGSIEYLYRSISGANSALDIEASHLTTLLWLERTTDHPRIEDIRNTLVARLRLDAMREMATELRTRGEAGHVASLLADHTLAYLLLYDGQAEEAKSIASDAVRRWRPRLTENDPILRSLTALDATADVVVAHENGAEVGPLLARLDEVEASLSEWDSSRSTRVLVMQVRSTLEDTP